MKYYKKIQAQSNDYESGYWNIITDPDGKVRNRLEEEEKFIKNTQSELDFINAMPAGKILDIGCGLGFLLKTIEDKHEKFGVELSEFAADCAKPYATIYNQPFETINFGKEKFDLIIAHHVIEHVENPEIFLTKIKEILAPDGTLILATPDFESICAKLFKQNYRMLHDKTHTNLFSFNSLKQMVEDFGFDIIKFEFPYFESEYYTPENVLKMLDYDKNTISPACWGNFMTFYLKNN